MPEYLAPGVYVEETSFRAKSIEGVGTSTTAFAGPTRKGPIATAERLPEILTSYADFERIYGGYADLQLTVANVADARPVNYLAHAVRAYFNEGGSRLYVAATVQRHCGGCGQDLPVAAGARRVVCFGCGFLVDVGIPEIPCHHCGSPLSAPAGAQRLACPRCRATTELVRPASA